VKGYWLPEARDRLQEIKAYSDKDSPQGTGKIIDRFLRRS
jgi:hypothetical protein